MKVGLFQIAISITICMVYVRDVASQEPISECDSYKAVYDTFSSCVLNAAYNNSVRYMTFFDKDILSKTDVFDVIDYWCSILGEGASCANGAAILCPNRQQIASLLGQTGGLCVGGKMSKTYKEMLDILLRDDYDTSCIQRSHDVIGICERRIPEIGNDVNIADGAVEMQRILVSTVECILRQLFNSRDDCVRSPANLIFFALRALSYSVPHALGVELHEETLMNMLVKQMNSN